MRSPTGTRRAAPDFWVWRLLSTLFVRLCSLLGTTGKWAMVNLGSNGDLDRWDSRTQNFRGRTGKPSPSPKSNTYSILFKLRADEPCPRLGYEDRSRKWTFRVVSTLHFHSTHLDVVVPGALPQRPRARGAWLEVFVLRRPHQHHGLAARTGGRRSVLRDGVAEEALRVRAARLDDGDPHVEVEALHEGHQRRRGQELQQQLQQQRPLPTLHPGSARSGGGARGLTRRPLRDPVPRLYLQFLLLLHCCWNWFDLTRRGSMSRRNVEMDRHGTKGSCALHRLHHCPLTTNTAYSSLYSPSSFHAFPSFLPSFLRSFFLSFLLSFLSLPSIAIVFLPRTAATPTTTMSASPSTLNPSLNVTEE